MKDKDLSLSSRVDKIRGERLEDVIYSAGWELPLPSYAEIVKTIRDMWPEIYMPKQYASYRRDIARMRRGRKSRRGKR